MFVSYHTNLGVHTNKLAEQALWDYAKSFLNGTLVDVEMDQEDNSTDSSGWTRHCYLSSDGSPVKEYLDSIKQKITKGLPPIELQRGQAWISPPYNPTSRNFGSYANPGKHYAGDIGCMCLCPQFNLDV
jgi:hypothetical protein